MKPQYSMVIQWSSEDDCYVVYVPDFEPYFMQPCTDGETYEEAASQGKDVIESMIYWLQEDGVPLPEAKVIMMDSLSTANKVA
ncbi:MAG: type II toxin-antitoxin system HicB family antitoxin [Cyanobacteria bacterium P01_D01_bin.1]